MKDLGVWSVVIESGRVYFKYRNHYMGQYMGSVENAEYMVVCINAALHAWSAIDDEVQAEAEFNGDAPSVPVRGYSE